MTVTPHLDADYEQELRRLRSCLLALADRTEDSVRDATRTLVSCDAAVVAAVQQRHDEVRGLVAACDDHCVRLLVRRRPVGRDLRHALVALKTVTELERISELAVNIVHRVGSLTARQVPREIEDLGRAAAAELTTALEAVRLGDADRARTLQVRDSASNARNRAAIQRLHGLARQEPGSFEDLLALTSVCRYLERIGDHATAIARRVVYATEGVTLPHLDESETA